MILTQANCQVHGLFNLFIADSSVSPSGGFANPTFTLGALAIRLVDHVKTVMEQLPKPSAVVGGRKESIWQLDVFGFFHKVTKQWKIYGYYSPGPSNLRKFFRMTPIQFPCITGFTYSPLLRVCRLQSRSWYRHIQIYLQ